jgi:hypothetical protein
LSARATTTVPFSAAAGGVRVAVRLTPKASRDAVDGLRPTAEGGAELAVKVTAPAERGKANAALIRLLAREWRLPPSDLALVAGAGDRHKQLMVQGEPKELLALLGAWLEERVG